MSQTLYKVFLIFYFRNVHVRSETEKRIANNYSSFQSNIQIFRSHSERYRLLEPTQNSLDFKKIIILMFVVIVWTEEDFAHWLICCGAEEMIGMSSTILNIKVQTKKMATKKHFFQTCFAMISEKLSDISTQVEVFIYL